MKKIFLNQNLQGFIIGHHNLLHGSCFMPTDGHLIAHSTFRMLVKYVGTKILKRGDIVKLK